jgi:alkanesulfonate monooxygenase SsuD/methylene tetrahydromethanopterin reductase-like flavin-dependent oxidoreductase (luciferase family)
VQNLRFRSGSAAQQTSDSARGATGDGWHPIGGVPTIPLEPQDIAADMSMLREYAEKAGRDAKKIRVALKGSLFDREKQITPGKRRRFIGCAEEVASDIRDYRAVGVDTMIFDVRRPTIAETLERMEWMAQGRFPAGLVCATRHFSQIENPKSKIKNP